MASKNEHEKRETLADIVAKMVRESNIHVSIPTTYLKSYADRIDAAWKREKAEIEANALAVGGVVEAARHKPGNAAAMREALREITGLFRDIDLTIDCPENEAYAIAAKALSAPPRNCDVGTAEEQTERFLAFCKKGRLPQFAESAFCAHECSCRESADCRFAWAQTPYEAEEGAGE